MCNFKSAIVIKDAKSKGGFQLLLSPWTESHSELEIIFKLRETTRLNYAKVEFSPAYKAEAYKVETYKLKIDEERKPDWLDGEMVESVTEKLTAYIRSIIVVEKCELLVGGQFIIGPGAEVMSAHSVVFNAICGGTVNAIRGGTVNDIWGGTVNDIWGDYYPTIKNISKDATIVRDNRKAKP